ncbi:thiol-disulfide isomerase [Stutzerimonas urumqiensis]|uniref:DUF6436 domain-containing protein n=1 Tax=Stutzerimonas urumqiensis TaxID=638269 RepID=UPI003DA5BF0D
MTPRRKFVLALLVLGLWAAGFWLARGWYQDSYLRTFDTRAVLFNGDGLALPQEIAGAGPIRLVHFWDPACPCNVGNQQHLAELIERYAGRGVAFYSLRKAAEGAPDIAPLPGLQPLARLEGAHQLPASPAVAIWDTTGRLVYVGPYSEGAVCTSSNSFIEPILESLLQGRPVSATHSLASGCFCDWTDR